MQNLSENIQTRKFPLFAVTVFVNGIKSSGSDRHSSDSTKKIKFSPAPVWLTEEREKLGQRPRDLLLLPELGLSVNPLGLVKGATTIGLPGHLLHWRIPSTTTVLPRSPCLRSTSRTTAPVTRRISSTRGTPRRTCPCRPTTLWRTASSSLPTSLSTFSYSLLSSSLYRQ